MSNWAKFARNRPVLRTSFIVFLNVALFIFISFPNPVLFIKQLQRQSKGIDSMVVTDNPRFVKFAEEAYNYSHRNPEDYVCYRIKERPDYEVYWNVEYWAYPHETIEKGAGDCEDMAILLKAVYKYIEEKYGRDYKERIVKQPVHYYVIKNDTERNLTIIYGWRMEEKDFEKRYPFIVKIQTYFNAMPLWRWFLYLLMVVFLNYEYYRTVYRVGNHTE